MPRTKTKASPKKTTKIDFGLVCDTDWSTEKLPTGIVPIDYILNGGFGYGRFAEIFGNYSSGKSYLLYLALIQNQKRGGTSILLEEEGAYDPTFFQRLGGDTKSLVLPSKVDTCEDVFDAINEICKIATKEELKNICIGWDSIAATSTKHLEETGMEKRDMSKALAMSTGCQLIRSVVKKSGVCVIATNQTRELINVKYGPKTGTPGGRGYPFICSQRIELSFKGGVIMASDKDKTPVGRQIKVRVDKNKLGPAMRDCTLYFYTEDGDEHPVYKYPTSIGIDENESLFDFYLKGRFHLPPRTPDERPWEGPRVVNPNGAWYTLDESIDPSGKSFRSGEWVKKLEEFPNLRTLPMEHLDGANI